MQTKKIILVMFAIGAAASATAQMPQVEREPQDSARHERREARKEMREYARDHGRMERFDKRFEEMDTNNDGAIDKREWHQAYERMLDKPRSGRLAGTPCEP